MNHITQTLTNVIHLAARLGTATCLGLTLLAFADHWVYGEQFASMRPYFAMSAALALAWFGVFRQWRWGAVALALCAGNAAIVHVTTAEHLNLGREAANVEGSARFLVVNAYIANPDQTRLARLASDTRADVVLVSELDVSLRDALATAYPSTVEADSGGVSGMGVFSRYPLTDTQVVRSAFFDLPMISTVVHLPQGPTRLMLVHPLPPGNTIALEERNALIADVARRAATERLPVVVAGDFNTTTWSTHLEPLHRVARRADTPATWPAHLPLRIPIDHLFYRGFSERAVFTFDDDLGTDHVPFLVVLD